VCAVQSVVPAPPGIAMVAPPKVPRNAEGRKAKAALCYRDGLNNAANNTRIIKARTPRRIPRPKAQETLAGDHALQWVLCVVYAGTRGRTGD
jgi:hypothetical protein